MRTRDVAVTMMASALVFGCTKQEMTRHQDDGGTFVACCYEQEETGTKVGFSRKGEFFWSEGDQIGVRTTAAPTRFISYALSSGAGQKKGIFKARQHGDPLDYAVYPWIYYHEFHDNLLEFNFAKEYTYEKVDRDYFTLKPGVGNSFNPAMWGKIEGKLIHFKHLGGVLCLKVNELPIGESMDLKMEADQQLSGTYKVDLSVPEPKATAVEGNVVNSSVTIHFSNQENGRPGVFYIPVPTGQFTGLKMKITGGDKPCTATFANTFIERCHLHKLVVEGLQ